MAEGDVEVHPQRGFWIVKVEGQRFGSSMHVLESDAVDSGRALARSMRVGFVERGQEERIKEKDSHGNDQRNVPG